MSAGWGGSTPLSQSGGSHAQSGGSHDFNTGSGMDCAALALPCEPIHYGLGDVMYDEVSKGYDYYSQGGRGAIFLETCGFRICL